MSEQDSDRVSAWLDREVVGPDGEKIGKVDDVYLDDESGLPTWLAVRTGLFGGRASLVPIEGALDEGEDVRVPYDKARVKGAPNLESDGELSAEEEGQLYRYYAMAYDQSRSVAPIESDDAVLTLAEEELRVGVKRTEAGRVRLRKYIVTEHVRETVPVRREEIRVHREAIVDAGPAPSGLELSEEQFEVTLHTEEAVAEKRVVPKERVRLDKQVVVEQQVVRAELRKERLDTTQLDTTQLDTTEPAAVEERSQAGDI